MWTIKRALSGRGLGHVTQFRNFGTPLITFEGIELSAFKFGTDIQDGASLRTDYKTTPKWEWPRSRDPISKFWDQPNNF